MRSNLRFVLLLLAAACRGPATSVSIAPFPAPGFDPSEEQAQPWDTDDRALMRVLLEGETAREWEVEIAVGRKWREPLSFHGSTENGQSFSFVSPVIEGTVRAREVGESTAEASVTGLPARFLQHGFYHLGRMLCEAYEEYDAEGDFSLEQTQELRRALETELMKSIAAAISFLQIAQGDPVLSKVFWQVIEKPSLLSMLRHRGVNLNMTFGPDAPHRVVSDLPRGLEGRPVFALPFEIELNGKIAMTGEIWSTEPTPPLHVVAGIVRVEGRHPGDPSRVMSLELRGARHGAETADSVHFSFPE